MDSLSFPNFVRERTLNLRQQVFWLWGRTGKIGQTNKQKRDKGFAFFSH